MKADEETLNRQRQRLSERMAALGMESPRDLAKASEIALATIYRILAGTLPVQKMKWDRLEKLAGALRVSPLWFFQVAEPPPDPDVLPSSVLRIAQSIHRLPEEQRETVQRLVGHLEDAYAKRRSRFLRLGSGGRARRAPARPRQGADQSSASRPPDEGP